MNILFEIGHPAHFYKFENTIKTLSAKNHRVIVIIRDSPIVISLLRKSGFTFFIIGRKKDHFVAKAFMQMLYLLKTYRLIKQNNIDLMVGSVTTTLLSKLTSIPSLLMDDDDDEIEPLYVKYVHPFATAILSPDSLNGKRKRKDTVYYPGYHELAYLHPNQFTADSSVLLELGLKSDEPYFVLRFNAFKAHHDVKAEGLSFENKRRLIKILEAKGKVFISSERAIDKEFEKYQLNLSPEKMHSVLYFATMFLGDSQTMTSEAAVLGTPALKCNSFAGKLSVPNELEYKYQLCYSFLPISSEGFFEKIEELIITPNLKSIFKIRKERMLADKIDVTEFYISYIETFLERRTSK